MKPAVREQLLHSQPLRRSDRDRPHQRDDVVKSWGVGEGLVYSSQDTIRAKSPGSVFFGFFLRHDLICSRERCCYSLSNPSHVWLFRHRVCRQLQMGFLFFFFYKHLKSSGTLTIVCLFLAVRILRGKQETKTSDVATDRDWTDILKMTKVAPLVWNKTKKRVCQHWSIGEPAW